MSEAIRTWGLRLLALGIAIGLWFGVSFEDRDVLSERLVEASVSYISPKGLVILDPVESVSVRVRGSSKEIRQLNPLMVGVQVDLSKAGEGVATVNLGPENVIMPESLTLLSIEPNVIQIELEREVSQRIPVVPELVGQAAAGAKVAEPEVYPNQVLVTGPESLLAKTEVLRTRSVSLAGKNATFEELVSVVPPDPLIQILQPTRVRVRVPIQPAEAETDDGAPAAQTEGS